MSHINLLPWREELLQIRNKRFYAEIGVCVLVSIAIVIFLHMLLASLSDIENANITYLKNEEGKITEQIKEIRGLQENKKDLLERMSVIQSLQYDRVLIVKLLDALPYVVPEGVQFTTLSRVGNEVTVEGMASSNAKISEFLKNLTDPKLKGLFSNVRLTEVATEKGGVSLTFKALFQLQSSLQEVSAKTPPPPTVNPS